MKTQSILGLALALGLAVGAPVATAADDHGGHSSHGAAMSPAITGASAPVPGEVKKVDKEAGKLTIKHAELKNLGMPAMTMVFQVKDKAMLDRVKVGDQVDFIAEQVEGKLTVTQLETRK